MKTVCVTYKKTSLNYHFKVFKATGGRQLVSEMAKQPLPKLHQYKYAGKCSNISKRYIFRKITVNTK